MGNPFDRYEKAKAEFQTDVLEIEGEKFEFPSQVSAKWGMDYTELLLSDDPQSANKVLQMHSDILKFLLGEERHQRLVELTTLPQYQALAEGLLREYGILSFPDEEGELPNREARRAAAKTSRRTSSPTSARSEQPSGATTT